MTDTIDFAGNEHIGVYTRVFDDVAFVPPEAPEEYISAVGRELHVEVAETTIQGSSIVGSLLVGNSCGFVVSGLASALEIEFLKG